MTQYLKNIIPLLVLLLLASAATADETKLSPQEAKDGFVSLFDGTSLDAWREPRPKEFRIENGILVVENGVKNDLYTKKEYADFILRFDVRLGEGSNNGIGIRSPLGPLRASYSGMEVQVLDETYYPRMIGDKMFHLKPWQHHGSIYGLVASKPGHLKPLGQWNQEEIKCKGRRIEVTLNGVKITDADLDKIPAENIQNEFGKGWQRKKGHIVIIGYNSGHPVEFRNIRVKEISKP